MKKKYNIRATWINSKGDICCITNGKADLDNNSKVRRRRFKEE